AFLAQDIAVGQSPLADRAFDHRSKAPRDIAEELVACVDQFIRPVIVRSYLALRWRQLVWRRRLLRRTRSRPAHQPGKCDHRQTRTEIHETTPCAHFPGIRPLGLNPMLRSMELG